MDDQKWSFHEIVVETNDLHMVVHGVIIPSVWGADLWLVFWETTLNMAEPRRKLVSNRQTNNGDSIQPRKQN